VDPESIYIFRACIWIPGSLAALAPRNDRVKIMTSLDRQQAFTGTKEAAPALRLDAARLAAYLAQHVPGFAGPLTVKQFKGGQSNPTYLLETPARRST